VVAEGRRGRVYLSSDAVGISDIEKPVIPEVDRPMTNDHRWFSPPLYGLPYFSDIFTPARSSPHHFSDW
jgi:putative DNA methylase